MQHYLTTYISFQTANYSYLQMQKENWYTNMWKMVQTTNW